MVGVPVSYKDLLDTRPICGQCFLQVYHIIANPPITSVDQNTPEESSQLG